VAERPGPNDLQPCGTPAARQRHFAHGELLCEACQELDPGLGYEPRHARSDRQEVTTGA
jgi:hypothetical protein